jgi:hypothetical protein
MSDTNYLIPKEWLDSQERKRKEEIKQQRQMHKGQKCSNCKNHVGHPFSPKYHYCRLGRSVFTPNGFAKVKASGWCDRWKKE